MLTTSVTNTECGLAAEEAEVDAVWATFLHRTGFGSNQRPALRTRPWGSGSRVPKSVTEADEGETSGLSEPSFVSWLQGVEAGSRLVLLSAMRFLPQDSSPASASLRWTDVEMHALFCPSPLLIPGFSPGPPVWLRKRSSPLGATCL